MDKIIKQDDAVMKTLGIHTINRIICGTDKGFLSLQIRKGEKNYHLVLDAVPLTKEDNKVLMDLLFPAPIPQEVPKVNKYAEAKKQQEKVAELRDDAIDKEIQDKGVVFTNNVPPNMLINKQPKGYKAKTKNGKMLGRPRGSKDGVKNMK